MFLGLGYCVNASTLFKNLVLNLLEIKFEEIVDQINNEIISNGYFHFIGSDAHNSNKRNFCIKDSYDYIQSIHSVDLITTLKSNVEDLLMGKTIYSISNLYFSNKKVNKIYKLKKMLLKFVGL